MKNNEGVTLVNVLIIVVVLVILAAIPIMNGSKTIEDAKKSQKEEKVAAVKAIVNEISLKQATAGVFPPANSQIYGIPVESYLQTIEFSGDVSDFTDWYILEPDTLEEMGIKYDTETYAVNYTTNEVCTLNDFKSSKYLYRDTGDSGNVVGEYYSIHYIANGGIGRMNSQRVAMDATT